MKTLDDINFYDRTVLLRADLNSDVVNDRVIKSERIRAASESISELKRRGAKVVVIAHQGRAGKDDFVSLKTHARLLNKFVKIKFIDDILGEKAIKAIENLKIGKVILLENIRFEEDEFKPEKGKNNKLIKNLLPLIDVYINDAFSVCHRIQTSIVGFPKYVNNGIGRLLEKELKALKNLKIEKSLIILGGAKPEDNIKFLKGNKILSCGLFGQMCLIAKGFKFGAQDDYLKKEIKNFNAINKTLKRKLKNVETPIDFAVKVNGKRKELKLEEFPSEYKIFDIGGETIKNYTDEIRKSSSIFMKGPAGDCSDKRFCRGTYSILKAISKKRGFSLIGGGHLSNAIRRSGISRRKFGHVSLSGGAMLRYINGEKLAGLRVLEQ